MSNTTINAGVDGLWADMSKSFMEDPFKNTTTGIGAIGDIGLGILNWQQQKGLLDMYKEQLDMQKEQWAETKQELNHKRGVRNNITNKYMGTAGVNYAQ